MTISYSDEEPLSKYSPVTFFPATRILNENPVIHCRHAIHCFISAHQSGVVRVSCQIQWKMTKQQHLPTFPLILLNYVNLEITLEWNYFGQSKQYKVGKRYEVRLLYYPILHKIIFFTNHASSTSMW